VPAAERTPGLIVSTRMHEAIYDLPTVIAAAAHVLAERPHTTLVVAGHGSQRGALERLAAEHLPAGRWHFTGRLEPAAMAELLGRAEVVISASHSDSTSQSLLETMASGAIPVVSDLEGNREWVGEGMGHGCSRSVMRAPALPPSCASSTIRHGPRWRGRGIAPWSSSAAMLRATWRASRMRSRGSPPGGCSGKGRAHEASARARVLLSAARGWRCASRVVVHASSTRARLVVHRGVRRRARLLGA
jgi:hypothetical protein